jgi:molybdopterin molybdotransferase
MVTFMTMVRPFVLRLQGVTDVMPARYTLRADFDWKKPDARLEFLRVKMNANGGLDLFHNQGAGVVTSLCWGDGVIANPPGQPIAAGDYVSFIPFAELLG